MVDSGAIAHLSLLISNKDAKLKVCVCVCVCIIIILLTQRQVFSALSQIAKHSVELAEMVVEAEIFPSVLNSLRGM